MTTSNGGEPVANLDNYSPTAAAARVKKITAYQTYKGPSFKSPSKPDSINSSLPSSKQSSRDSQRSRQALQAPKLGTKDTLYLRKASGMDLDSSAGVSYVDGSGVLKPLLENNQDEVDEPSQKQQQDDTFME